MATTTSLSEKKPSHSHVAKIAGYDAANRNQFPPLRANMLKTFHLLLLALVIPMPFYILYL